MRTQEQILDDNSLTDVQKAKEVANNIIGDRFYDEPVFSNSKFVALKDYLIRERLSDDVVFTDVEVFDDICSGGISPDNYGKILGDK